MSREDYECGINNLKLDAYSQIEYNRKKNVEQDKSITVIQSKINEIVNQRPSGFLPRVYYGLTRGINTYRFNMGTRLNIEGIQGEIGDAFEFVVPSETKNYITAVGVMVGENQIEITVQGDYDERFTSFDLVNMRTGALLENADLGNVLVNQNASYLGDYNANDNINKQITVLYDLQSNEENIIFASVDFSGDEKFNWVRIGGYSNGVNGKSMYCIKADNIDNIMNKAMVGDNLLAGEAFIYITYTFQIGDLYVIDNMQPLTLTKIGNLRGAQGAIGATGPKGDNGTDGATPTIVNNVWYINGESTGVTAVGTNGADGQNGQAFEMVSTLFSAPENYGQEGNVGPNGETLSQLPTLPQAAISGKGYLVYDPLTTPLNPFFDLYYANNADVNWTIIHPFSPIRGNDGINGDTPYIVNGFWYIGGTNTGVNARGEQGPVGPQGPRGPQGPQGEPIPADDELSKTSVNAVQNRVIATKIEEMDERIATNEDNIQLAPIKNQNNTYTGRNIFEYGNSTIIDISDAGLSIQNGDGKEIYITPQELVFEDSAKPHSQVIEYEQAELLVNEYDKTSNLFNMPKMLYSTPNGLTYSINDGEVIINGESTSSGWFGFETTVYFDGVYSINLFESGIRSNTQFWSFRGNSLNVQVKDVNTPIMSNFSISNTTSNYFGMYIPSGSTFTNYKIKPMLVKGATAPSTFHAYNGPIVHQKDLGELIWKNSSPTSSFEEKTIALDLSKFNKMLVVFRRSVNSESQVTCMVLKNNVNTEAIGIYENILVMRQVSFNPNNIVHINAGVKFSNYGVLTNDNSVMIPIEIYGIK